MADRENAETIAGALSMDTANTLIRMRGPVEDFAELRRLGLVEPNDIGRIVRTQLGLEVLDVLEDMAETELRQKAGDFDD